MANVYGQHLQQDVEPPSLYQEWNQSKAALSQLQAQAQNGPAGQALQPKRPPEIQVAAATLNDRVNVLMKELQTLEQRLEVVLRPQPPQSTAAPNVATQNYGAATQLGQSIAQATANIDVSINRVRGMLDLLEL